MVELCLGVGMRRRLPSYHCRSPGTSPRENSYLAVSKKCIQCILATRERNLSHYDDFYYPTFHINQTKVFGNQSKVKYDGFIVPLSQQKNYSLYFLLATGA